jgi:hypothetical protein
VARVRQNVSQAVFMRTAGLPAQLLISAVPVAKRIAVFWNSGASGNLRDTIHDDVCRNGYDHDLGAFVQ